MTKRLEKGRILLIKKYTCPCGYEYDPKVGEPSQGIAPGTPWEEVYENFECPICGLGKDAFEVEG